MPARLQILCKSNGSRVTQRGGVSLLDPHSGHRASTVSSVCVGPASVVRFVVVAAPLGCLLPHYTPGSLHGFRPFDDGVTVCPLAFRLNLRGARGRGLDPGDRDQHCWQKPALPVAKTIAHNQRPRKIPKLLPPSQSLTHPEPLTSCSRPACRRRRSWRWCRRWALDCCVRIAEGGRCSPATGWGSFRDGCQVLLRGTRPRLGLGVYVPTGQYPTKRHRVTQHARTKPPTTPNTVMAPGGEPGVLVLLLVLVLANG